MTAISTADFVDLSAELMHGALLVLLGDLPEPYEASPKALPLYNP
jgi:hypothetical protein